MPPRTHHDIQGFFATTEDWLVDTLFEVLTIGNARRAIEKIKSRSVVE